MSTRHGLMRSSGMRTRFLLDGDSHYTEAGEDYDRLRTGELNRLRVRAIRFTNEDVMQRFEAVCEAIREAVEVGRKPSVTHVPG
ncbi:MAG: DUF559 domain-containing protein [Betaproteobacteria bacterium]